LQWEWAGVSACAFLGKTAGLAKQCLPQVKDQSAKIKRSQPLDNNCSAHGTIKPIFTLYRSIDVGFKLYPWLHPLHQETP
jgi:hypothetical protein